MCVCVCVPVQIDKDDTLRVIYQPFQLSGFVPQLISLQGAVHSHILMLGLQTSVQFVLNVNIKLHSFIVEHALLGV